MGLHYGYLLNSIKSIFWLITANNSNNDMALTVYSMVMSISGFPDAH